MIDLDHPVTQKVLAAVVTAGLIGIGSVGWNAGVRVKEQDAEIRALKEDTAEIKPMLQDIGKDVSEIRTDVAVLKERTERADAAKRPGP